MFVLVTNFSKQERKPYFRSFLFGIDKYNGYTYSVLKIKRKKLIDTRKIYKLIGNIPVVFSKDLKEISAREFNFANNIPYKRCVFENGIKIFFKDKRFDKAVTLIDFKCRYLKIADVLIKHFKTLRIITADPKIYEEYAAVKQNTCGAVVVVTNRLELSSDTEFIVAPEGITFEVLGEIKAPVISIDGLHNLNLKIKTSIHSFKPQAAIIPYDVLTEDYFAALYYYCGIRESAMLTPKLVTINSCEEDIFSVKIPLIN